MFQDDYLTFLHYLKSHQIRVTTLQQHIPLRHLKDLRAKMKGHEPFHPIHSSATYEMRAQRDACRIDFMDQLATAMGLLERSQWGYIIPGPGWGPFFKAAQEEQRQQIVQAFWAMDWSRLYPWMEITDWLSLRRKQIRQFLAACPTGKKIRLEQIALALCANQSGWAVNPTDSPNDSHRKDRLTLGIFWVIIRPLEYLGLAQSHFTQDPEGFYSPTAFEFPRAKADPS